MSMEYPTILNFRTNKGNSFTVKTLKYKPLSNLKVACRKNKNSVVYLSVTQYKDIFDYIFNYE